MTSPYIFGMTSPNSPKNDLYGMTSPDLYVMTSPDLYGMTSPDLYVMTSPDLFGMTSPDLVELDDNVYQGCNNIPCLADGAAVVLAPPSSITRGQPTVNAQWK